jgi:hypothetical protein
VSGNIVSARQPLAPQINAGHPQACRHTAKAVEVSSQACLGRLKSRLIYITRLTYWTARHRSLDTARWVVEYEGHSW